VVRIGKARSHNEAIMHAREISVKKYVVRLTGEERERLETLLRKGKSPAQATIKDAENRTNGRRLGTARPFPLWRLRSGPQSSSVGDSDLPRPSRPLIIQRKNSGDAHSSLGKAAIRPAAPSLQNAANS
jgi:hypothetical protein